MKNNTVVLTTLNSAWVTPNSVLDLFLTSFKLGNGTRRFLRHLVIIALDEKAYNRCRIVHRHCFALRTHGDADILWFRDPFTRFIPDADFQIACDYYKGSSDDMENNPNGGFYYVKSNNRTIEFYRFWFSSRETYPKHHDQAVLDKIKSHPYISEKIRLRIKFLDTAYFGGLCELSKDLNQVCTMHANCCYGMLNKLNDMKIMLQDWRTFNSLPLKHRNVSIFTWRVPRFCRKSDIEPKQGLCNSHGMRISHSHVWLAGNLISDNVLLLIVDFFRYITGNVITSIPLGYNANTSDAGDIPMFNKVGSCIDV
ncbi:hypothetical protein F3Y22_tig00110327pilonHSYRG00025 [Hibiscus syriacus]|uniref:Nucleotide-diphospho-sugar transferase domain-containing protein n=1 Tax=Hibiscus syriacus TaxID=106335 RepID=A0A6A3AZI8_HIBSY|nr:hypothetical protein F3Y22_tig00110327pilonHSYRG00025 [Hibiscus syriacus]